MADNPVTADKLTSQSVVSFGWIAEISNNTNLQRTFDEEKTWRYFTEMVEATLPSSFPLLEQTLTTSAAFCFCKGKYLWKEKNGGKRKGKKKKFQFLLLLPCWGKLYFVKIGFLYTMWHGPVDVLLYKDNVYTQYLCFFLLLLLLFCFIFFYTMYIFYTVSLHLLWFSLFVIRRREKKIMMPAGLIWLELFACMCIVLLLAQWLKLARFAEIA